MLTLLWWPKLLLRHAFCHLIDSLDICCQILTDFYQVNVQNNCSNISRWTLTGLKQLSFTWFSINHFLEKSVHLKSDHQDLLRNVCFQKLYFHCWFTLQASGFHHFLSISYHQSLNKIKLFFPPYSHYQTIEPKEPDTWKKETFFLYILIFCLNFQ